MTTKTKTTTMPTTAELELQLADARESLRRVRIDVHNGTADSKQLADAEAAVRFAETRIEAELDARQESARQANAATVKALADRLHALDDVKAKQAKQLETVRDALADYMDLTADIRQEIHAVYWAIHDLRQRGVKPDGFQIGGRDTSVTLNGTRYFAGDGVHQLKTWLIEAEHGGGRMSRKKG